VLTAYQQLLRLRREDAVLSAPGREGLDAGVAGDVLWVRRERAGQVRYVLVNFGEATELAGLDLPIDPGRVCFATHPETMPHLPRHGAVILEGAAR
jgi:hypothetical protein